MKRKRSRKGGDNLLQPHTPKMIRDTFVQMLNELPLNKITVKDIVARCQINRNTFYYYYADIYELLSEIFQTELQKAIDEYNANLSWEEGFLAATDFALQNKRAIYHVYNSMQREELEDYIYNVAGNIMFLYVEKESKGIPARERDKELIVAFYQCALTEIVMRWIASRMKEDPQVIIRRIGALFNGHIRRSLQRSAGMTEE